MQVRNIFSQPYHQRLRCGSLALVALTLGFVSAAQAQTAITFEEAISPDYSCAEAVQQTSDGGYAFSGQFYTGIGYYYGYNAWMVKTDSSGNVKLQKAYGNANYAATFQKVGLTSVGGFVAGDGRSSTTIRMKPTL